MHDLQVVEMVYKCVSSCGYVFVCVYALLCVFVCVCVYAFCGLSCDLSLACYTYWCFTIPPFLNTVRTSEQPVRESAYQSISKIEIILIIDQFTENEVIKLTDASNLTPSENLDHHNETAWFTIKWLIKSDWE